MCIIDTPVAYRFSLIVMYVYLSDRVRRIKVGQSESVHECRSPCSQQRPRPTRVKTAPTVKRAPSSVVPVDTEQEGRWYAGGGFDLLFLAIRVFDGINGLLFFDLLFLVI